MIRLASSSEVAFRTDCRRWLCGEGVWGLKRPLSVLVSPAVAMLSLSSVSAIESPLLCSSIGEETLVGDVTVMVDVGVGVDVLELAFSGMGGAVEDLLGPLVVCDE